MAQDRDIGFVNALFYDNGTLYAGRTMAIVAPVRGAPGNRRHAMWRGWIPGLSPFIHYN
jgi:hypothetical protein